MRLDTFEPAGGSESPLYHHATELVAYRPLRRYLPRMPVRRPSSSERHGLRAILGVIFGAFIGFLLATQIRNTFLGREGIGNSTCAVMGVRHSPAATGVDDDPVFAGMQNGDTVHNSSRALLFVGVMTAQKYLDTRARAVYETWGRELPGRMAFFSSANSVTSADIPLVRLIGVDDSYPPQKKSFLMLKYMYEHFGDKFEWFMRADDDVYVRPEKLEALLRSVDSKKPQFIGQAGRGSQEEFGLLSLEYDENFCMGGPGVLMSRATLARVAPHVAHCLRNLYTTHEDVELGRCVQRFAGIPCTWSYEMQTILYHNSSGSEAFTGKLKYKEVHRAITLHPVKQYKHLYRVHNYMRALSIQDLQHRALLLRRDINSMQTLMGKPPSSEQQYRVENLLGLAPSLHKYRARRHQHLLTWEFFTHALYSATNANPRRRIESALREGLDDVIREVMEMTNAYSRQRGRILDFKEVLYGYHRVNPLAGQELVLDMQLVYRKYRGRKMTIPVRRHSYLQRAFVGLEVRETSDGLPVDPSSQESRNRRAVTDDLMGGVLGPAAGLVRRPEPRVKRNPARDKLITFLVPLSGRLTTFKRFAALYEEVCLQGGQLTSLVLVLFPSDDVADTVAVVTNMQKMYPHASLSVLPVFVPFARGLALQLGAAHVQAQNPDSILFFIDVDVVFTVASLQRVRLNTILGRQAYYPIVFSEFDPGVVYGNGTISAPNHFLISDDTGYWRNYGFGIASVYPSDLNTAGGFDTAIRGWGKEDVDLYDKFVRSNVTVFRAADPGLVHVFHIVECDSSLDAPQLAMCHGTRANTYAGVSQLTRIVDKDPKILQYARENNKGKS